MSVEQFLVDDILPRRVSSGHLAFELEKEIDYKDKEDQPAPQVIIESETGEKEDKEEKTEETAPIKKRRRRKRAMSQEKNCQEEKEQKKEEFKPIKITNKTNTRAK